MRNDGFLLRKSLAGKMLSKPDTTICYATSPLGLIAKIVLCRQDSLKMLVYDGQDHVVDSMPLKPGKHASLLKSKDDVFLLYRGWLELQSQHVQEALRQTKVLLHRQDTSLYIQAYLLENRRQLLLAAESLKSRQQDIERKISVLILPDKEMVEHMLQNAYPDPVTEITYLSGGMGFAYMVSHKRGEKVYELSNHLGNVVATVSDKKVGLDNGDGVVVFYNVDVVNSTDYYPFVSLLPGRVYSLNNEYRYGFNGKEDDNEVKGDGNQQDYGARIYDPRLGRFLSVDPITAQYPQLTPYQFASNGPIDGIDLDGLERLDYRLTMKKGGHTQLTFVSSGPTHYGFLQWFEKIPQYYRVEYNGNHYFFSAGANKGGNIFETYYSIKSLNEFIVNPHPENLVSEEQSQRDFWTEMLGRTAIGLTAEISNRAIGNVNSIQWRGRYTSLPHSEPEIAVNESRLLGREVIVDENLSPSIVKDLEKDGFNVKSLPKSTSDEDIIAYAKKIIL
ncbi:RHS repeat-associated core domain-containing protein [Chitinophaga costaii]|nr:RHS repeat-associated core domain-containing protein [Chitinophaga costaii]